jgi:phospholipase C
MEIPVKYALVSVVLLSLFVAPQTINALPPGGGLDRVNHIIVLTQENHSFDNYFGVLPYTPGANYHKAAGHGPCDSADHQCVDGLTCTGTVDTHGEIPCANSNPTFNGDALKVVHQPSYCSCNPEHEWVPAHQNANYENPNSTSSPLDGFARTNAKSKKLADTVMSFYTEVELHYYYKLAETFSISDRHFSSVIGPTLPNRMYQMAATSFSHVVTDPLGIHAENSPPEGGYRPKNGTIFDLLDKHKVSWAEYYEWNEPDSSAPLRLVFTPPRPYGLLFRQPYSSNFKPLATFFEAAKAGRLPQVAFIDLNQHEHPP